jgi:hypothetical protein
MIQLSARSEVRMRRVLRPINLRSVVFIIVIVLGFGSAFPAAGQAVPVAQNPDGPAGNPTPNHVGRAAGGPHSVRLSWNASVPATKAPRDAVVGYNVYRSTKSHDRNPKRVNSKLCPGTTYVDPDVAAGKTYFYVTRGVNANGVESLPSNEAKVVMPPR